MKKLPSEIIEAISSTEELEVLSAFRETLELRIKELQKIWVLQLTVGEKTSYYLAPSKLSGAILSAVLQMNGAVEPFTLPPISVKNLWVSRNEIEVLGLEEEFSKFEKDFNNQ